jgi:hypothetical protein
MFTIEKAGRESTSRRAAGFDWRGIGEFAGVGAPRIRPPQGPLTPLRLVFEANGTRRPADRSAGLLKGNLNSVF